MRDELTRTLDAMEQCLVALGGIQTSFQDVLKGVKATGDIARQISSFVGGTLPKLDETSGCDLPKAHLTDKEYFRKLTSIFAPRSHEARMTILVGLIGATMDTHRDYTRKAEKLKERISLQVQAPERTIAKAQLTKMRASIVVLERRLSSLVDRFFKLRKIMLLRILGQTEMLVEKFKDDNGEVMPWFREKASYFSRTETYREDDAMLFNSLKK